MSRAADRIFTTNRRDVSYDTFTNTIFSLYQALTWTSLAWMSQQRTSSGKGFFSSLKDIMLGRKNFLAVGYEISWNCHLVICEHHFLSELYFMTRKSSTRGSIKVDHLDDDNLNMISILSFFLHIASRELSLFQSLLFRLKIVFLLMLLHCIFCDKQKIF